MQLQEQPTVASCAFTDTVKLRSSEHATSGPSTAGVVQSSKTWFYYLLPSDICFARYKCHWSYRIKHKTKFLHVNACI